MPKSESHAQKGKRKLQQIDNALYAATAYLYEYEYLLLRSDLNLANIVERMMMEIDETRHKLHLLYQACWCTDHETFDTVGDVPELIAQARQDVLKRSGVCQEFLSALGASDVISSRLLERRAEASLKQFR